MLVEACFGLGEALVSGKVNADRYVLDARTGAALKKDFAEKKLKVVPLDAGVHEVELPEAERRAPTLGDAQLAALARLGADVQAHYERPMDIEWALEGGRLELLQARPITKLNFAPDFGEWTNANFKDGGVASDVCAPFMASLYDEIFTSTMTEHWRALRLLPRDRDVDWLLVAFGKPYWNVGEVKRCVFQIPGFVERDLDEDLGMAVTYEGRGFVAPFTLRTALGALPTLLASKRLYRERLAMAKAFVPAFLADYDAWDAVEIQKLSDAEFRQRYERLLTDLYRRTESAYFLTVYNLSMAKTDFKLIFDKANAKAGGKLSYLNLVLGLRDVAHLRPFRELWDLAAEARKAGKRPDLAPFVKRWQHHSTRELDITVPRWGEDPSFVEQIYEQYVGAGGAGSGGGTEGADRDPVRQAENQRSVYEAERARVRELLRWRPILRWRLFLGLRRMRDYTWWREEMRDCSTRAYWLVRKWSLEAGRRAAARGALERADDVFMLEKPDALALAAGTLDAKAAREKVAAARRYLKSYKRFDNPNELGGRHAFKDVKLLPGKKVAAGAPRLSGVGGSPGRVRGKARIVRRLEEGKKVEKGDVLVTVFTDPGWTPLLSLVSAIVTETGGLLSHAAVISREYGIPAVLAATGAAEKLVDGQEVIVDGAAGTVEVAGP
jgi:phosphohistidine swiveling domain-containing protein